MIERLPFDDTADYIPSEIAVHVNRYAVAHPFCQGKRVLDIACGEGYGSYIMARKWDAKEVVGIDISREAIEKASSLFPLPTVSFLEGSAEQLDQLGVGVFDLIVCLETFEHVPDPAAMLRSFKRVLSPDGVLIVSCPNDNLYYAEDVIGNSFHERRYTFGEFQALSEQVLGPGTFMLGTGLAGFVTLPVSSRYIEGKSSYVKEVHELLAVDPVTCIFRSSIAITAARASYYVGVWGADLARLKETIAVVPTEREPYFVQQKFDECLRQSWEIDRLNARIAELENRLLTASALRETKALSASERPAGVLMRIAQKGVEFVSKLRRQTTSQ